MGIEVSLLMMHLSNRVYEFSGIYARYKFGLK